MMRKLATLAALAGLAACQPAAGGGPATPASPEAGRAPAFVEAVCGDCHGVEPPYASPNPLAPTFVDIANRPAESEAALAQWLRDAHNYPEAMEFDLDPPQADELAAYIVSLREEGR